MGRTSDAKSRILESALRLMHERGFANVGVEDIMNEAKVGKSSFYHFYPSKEALGEAVLDEYKRRMCDELLDKSFSETVDPLQRPLLLMRRIAQEENPVNGCLGGNGAAEHSFVSEPLREKALEFLRELSSRFEQAYADAVAEMDLHPDTPVEQLAEASTAYFEGLMLICRARKSWQPMTDLGPMVANLWAPYAI